MDWYYFWYVNKKKIWMLVLLLLVLLFVASLLATRGENVIGKPQKPATTTTSIQVKLTFPMTTTTATAATSTTDPRIPHAKIRMETEFFCVASDSCSGKEHPLCNGFWSCEKNLCMWYCWS